MTEMRELFDVRFNASGRGFTMGLKNGSIAVPDTPGCYVVSTGCGSGKTECCKSIIRQKHNEGILYCVDTVAELKKMHTWILDNREDIGIAASDVIIITSDNEHQECLRQYRNAPEMLMTKQIVLITHVRFWTDLINYFLIYHPGGEVGAFDGNFDSLMGRTDLRRYVIFDETPTFIKPFFSMPRYLLGCFANHIGDKWECLDSRGITEAYDKFIKDSGLSPFPKAKNKVNAIKRDVILGLVPDYFPQWIAATGQELQIAFTPLHLCVPVINTHLLILEGAGNVLFDNSKYYRLLDVGQKYNCKVSFESFPFNLKRRASMGKNFDDLIRWLTARLKRNEAAGKKTLVTVWKNQGEEYNTDSQGYYDMVVRTLGRKKIGRDSYKVIYYGSPQSKSTNDFRDFSEIVLAGVWNLPPSMDRIKQQYGVSIGHTHIRLWEFIQLLCRIGIRQHDGGEYTVCYSSDYSDIFINALKDYFESDTVPLTEVENEKYPDWLLERFGEIKIRGPLREDIIRLTQSRPEILEALRNRMPLDVDISLTDLYRTVKRSRKKRDEYKVLVNKLTALNINLTIK